MPMKRFIVPLLFCSLALFGLGCRKTASVATNVDDTNPAVFLPPSPPEETEDQRNLRELREAIEQFQNAKTFRAKLSVSSKDGMTNGQIDIMKPDRFHGTMRTPKESQTSEVIGVGDTLYARLPDGSWRSVSTPSVAKALNEAFRSAVASDSSVIRNALPDGTAVTKRPDAGKGCDHYRAGLNQPDGGAVNLDMCVSKGFPKFMDLQSPQGSVSVEYFDYNKLFVIERPTVAR